MKNQFIDIKKVTLAIKEIRLERDTLKKRQATLRVQEHRLKKLLELQ